MKALVYHGNEDVRVEERPKPVIGAAGDALVRVTATAICGSDLHLHRGVGSLKVPDGLSDGQVVRSPAPPARGGTPRGAACSTSKEDGVIKVILQASHQPAVGAHDGSQ